MIPLAEKLKKQLADRFDLPVFVFLWVRATARSVYPVYSRMLCLPCRKENYALINS